MESIHLERIPVMLNHLLGVVAGLIGYYVEINVSPAASLIVFLSLFFANFAVSWIAVILIMDGSLKDAQGRKAQIEIERAKRI